MPTHSHTFLVLVALQGNPARVAETVQGAVEAGMAVAVFTQDRFLERVESALSDLRATPSELRITGLHVYRTKRLRGMIRAAVGKLVRPVSRFAYRVTRFFRHRISLPPRVDKALEIGGRAARQAPEVSDDLVTRVVDPLLSTSATLATRASHVRSINSAVDDLRRRHRVFGVVCIDSTSLLAGWVLAKRYQGLPVLTSFPSQWDPLLVETFESMASGTRR